MQPILLIVGILVMIIIALEIERRAREGNIPKWAKVIWDWLPFPLESEQSVGLGGEYEMTRGGVVATFLITAFLLSSLVFV